MNESSLTLTQSKEICISITAMTAEFSWINNLDTIRSEIFRNFSEAKAFIEREQIQKKFALTDLGNVERFINLYPNEIRYVPEIAEFYFFDGKKWALDLGSKRTHELVTKRFDQFTTKPDAKMKKRAAKKSQNGHCTVSMGVVEMRW